MEREIGLDVHAASCTLAVILENRRMIASPTVPAEIATNRFSFSSLDPDSSNLRGELRASSEYER